VVDQERAARDRIDLVRYATDFYQEVVRIRRMIEQAAARSAMPDGAEDARLPDPEALLQRLQAVLDSQAVEVGRTGVDFLIADYREVQYVLAALADDIFLHDVTWGGRDVWNHNILEYRLFRSRVAGARVFETIAAVVRSGDGRRIAVAEVYLMALHLGFKGRFRESTDDAPLREYMRQLFIFVEGRPPELDGPERLLIPDAYAHTVADQSDRRMGLTLDWPWVAGGIVAAATLASVAVWMVVTADLGAAVSAAFDAALVMGR
jgi:type VI secretion system protein ImpK